MDQALERADRMALALTERIAAIGVIGIMGVGVMTVADVVMRAAFNAPIVGLNEITRPLLALGIAACLPAGAAGRVNITIDFTASLAGPRLWAWLRVLASVAMLAMLILVVWRLGAIAQRQIRLGQTSALLRLPVGYFLLAITALLALSVPVQIIPVLMTLRDAVRKGRVTALIVAALSIALLAVLLGDLGGLRSALVALLSLPPATLALLCFALMWVGILLGVPLGAATGLSGFLGSSLVLGTSPALTMFGTQINGMIFNDSLAVLPLFLLMGSFATTAGLSAEIYKLAHSVIGHVRGGLAQATVLGSAGFGALTGSSLATSATIGKVALPEMAARNYSRSLAAGTVAAGGTLGQLVPPSSVIVIYALLAEESIGTLFIAAIVPALLAVILYLLAIALTVRLTDVAAPAGQRQPVAEMLRATLRAWQVIVLVGLVIGGLYTGVFTETEAAAVGAVGAFIAALIRGTLRRETVWAVMRETTSTIAMVYVLIFGAVNFSFLVGISGLPNLFVSFMTGLTDEPLLIVLMIAVLYLLLGTIMDTFAIMIITVPVFLPLILQLGLDPIWWAIITICLVETGMITPPFGLNLFILKSLDPTLRLGDVYRGVGPFIAADLVKIALLIAFPIIVLWLPGTR